MKNISRIIGLLALTVSLCAGTEITFNLPDGIAHKIEKAQGKEIHIFQIEKDPSDPDFFNLGLAALMFFEVDEEQFASFENEFKGKTKEEIEEAMMEKAKSSKVAVQNVEYQLVSIGGFEGHRITTFFLFKFENTTYNKITQNNILRKEGKFWMANATALSNGEHLEQIDRILTTIQTR